MKKSLFKGHLLKDDDSKKLYESKSLISNFHKANPFDEKAEILSKLGINDWEQLYSLVKNESLKDLLKTTLKIQTDDELKNIQSICENALPTNQVRNLNEIEITNCPLGARKPKKIEKLNEKFVAHKYLGINSLADSERKLNEVRSFDNMPTFNFANSVNYIHQLSPIRSQGLARGTCTSFAVTAANEFSIFIKTRRYLDLSEQQLFYETKILENDSVCGSWIKNALQIISDKGQCLESIWSYNPNLPCVQQYGKPSNADDSAASFRNIFFIINQNDVSALKQALSSSRIIPFSIPIYDSWYHSAETFRTGRITLPLPGEQESGGHSMTMVGYQDDINTPGGGYFIIRNSWGTDWAKDNYYGAGYGMIPYEYITNYNWEAFAF